ncbi:MAG: hypothetical protein ACFFD4_28285 [Candidatus Odinarchaeota archaeon]
MGQYDEWFSLQLQELLQGIYKGENLSNILEQVRRGIEYGEGHPGEISKIFLDIGRAMLRVATGYVATTTPRMASPIGAPSQEIFRSGVPKADLDVNELKTAIQSRKKKKVREDMKGSIDALKDFDDD